MGEADERLRRVTLFFDLSMTGTARFEIFQDLSIVDRERHTSHLPRESSCSPDRVPDVASAKVYRTRFSQDLEQKRLDDTGSATETFRASIECDRSSSAGQPLLARRNWTTSSIGPYAASPKSKKPRNLRLTAAQGRPRGKIQEEQLHL